MIGNVPLSAFCVWGGGKGGREGGRGDPPPANSPIIHSSLACKKLSKQKKKKKEICHCIPKLAICPLTRSLHDLRKRVFCDLKDRQTDGHCDSTTAYSVKIPLTLLCSSFIFPLCLKYVIGTKLHIVWDMWLRLKAASFRSVASSKTVEEPTTLLHHHEQ